MSEKRIHKFGLMLTPRAASALHAAEFDLSDVRADVAAAKRDPDKARDALLGSSRDILGAEHWADHVRGLHDYADEVVRVAAGRR